MAVVGEHHPAFEEYCECIFELAEDDVDVIQARIAERLNVSRPAVSEMMRRLEAEGLIETEGDPPHRRRAAAGDEGRAPPPPGRALPHRHPPPVVGGGAPRGRQVGARHERGRRAGDGQPPRQPDHVPSRQPDPRLEVRRGRVAAAGERDGRRGVHDQPDHRGARVHARAARVPRGQRAAAGQRRHDHRGVAGRHAHGRDRRQARRGRRVRERRASWSTRDPAGPRPVPRRHDAPWSSPSPPCARPTYDTSATTVPATTSTVYVPTGSTAELLAALSARSGRSASGSSTTTASATRSARIEAQWAVVAPRRRTASTPSCCRRSTRPSPSPAVGRAAPPGGRRQGGEEPRVLIAAYEA